jgi:hypothetical protein
MRVIVVSLALKPGVIRAHTCAETRMSAGNAAALSDVGGANEAIRRLWMAGGARQRHDDDLWRGAASRRAASHRAARVFRRGRGVAPDSSSLYGLFGEKQCRYVATIEIIIDVCSMLFGLNFSSGSSLIFDLPIAMFALKLHIPIVLRKLHSTIYRLS